MVTDVYDARDQQVFRDGIGQLDEACRTAHGVAFMQATPAQRLSLLEALDREQKTAMEARSNPRGTNRAPAAPPAPDEPAHYFRMMKELALLGYFTSEIGYTQAMRYREAPGRFDPYAPHAPGDKSGPRTPDVSAAAAHASCSSTPGCRAGGRGFRQGWRSCPRRSGLAR